MKCTEKWLKQQIQEILNQWNDDSINAWEKGLSDLEISKKYYRKIEWVLGLLVEREKELREMRKKLDAPPAVLSAHNRGKADLIDEILGEI